MKRFHLHLHVDDLARNIAFYTAMFQQQPARAESDYAKWMLQDPPLNFAISTRGQQPGVDHLGIQVETAEELQALKAQARQADMALLDEGETSCCYARSDKYWITDPQGIAWEQFQTLDNIPVFSQKASAPEEAAVCCTPKAPATSVAATPAPQAACCTPTPGQAKSGARACC